MSPAVAHLLEEVEHLSPAEQAEFDHIRQLRLADAEDAVDEPTWDAAWGDELSRRIEDIDSGRVVCKPFNEVVEEIRAHLRSKRAS